MVSSRDTSLALNAMIVIGMCLWTAAFAVLHTDAPLALFALLVTWWACRNYATRERDDVDNGAISPTDSLAMARRAAIACGRTDCPARAA